MSKQFAPPPRPPCRAARPPAQAKPAPPPVAPRPPSRVAPPPVPARAAAPASVQRFASFANRTGRDSARPAPPGDELVALGDGAFGARDGERGLITRPDGTYNFVRTQGRRRMDQRLLISAKAGHAQLSQGSPVVYAGTMRFSRGALEWWSNYSGHYQPIAEFRDQAQLPGDKFVPWQKLQMGGTAMQRGMFRDRRPPTGPVAASDAETEGRDAGGGGAARDEAPASPAAAPRGATAAGKPEG